MEAVTVAGAGAGAGARRTQKSTGSRQTQQLYVDDDNNIRVVEVSSSSISDVYKEKDERFKFTNPMRAEGR